MKRFLLAWALMTLLAGCATQTVPQKITMENDWRTGTDQTPYRSIPTVLLCDDCRYQ